MTRNAFLVVSALAACFATNAFAAEVGSIKIGHWDGGAFTDDKTGAFSHCGATAGYVNGFSLTLGQNAERTWLIAIANSNWNLTPGETYPFDLTFDGQAQFHIYGTATPLQKQIAAILPNAAADRLRKSHLMIAAGKVQTVPFSLNDVDKLLPVIAYCVDRIKAGGLASAGDFVVLAKKTATPATLEKPTVATTERPPSPAKLFDKTGTGFVISASGHVVTNNHVIDRCVGDIHGNLVGESASTLRVDLRMK
jgi:hypothetical protein